MVPLFEAPMKARGSEVRRNGVERYVRFEYGDRNPRWMANQVKSAHRVGQARSNRPRSVPVAVIARAARAVASLFL